jgi:PAS domain S-box-containing protein
MGVQSTPYTLALLSVGGLLTAFALSLWYLGHEDETPGATLSGLLMLAGAAWVFCFTVQLSATTLAAKLRWRVVTAAAILSLAVVWLAYVCWYTGRSQWLSRRVFGLLSLAPASLMLVAATPTAVRALFLDAELLRLGSFVALDVTYAPVFVGYVLVGYALLVASLLLLAGAALGARGILRRQIAVLLSFATLPGGAALLDLLGYAPLPGLNFGPLSVAVTAVAGAFGVVRFEWLDLKPITRDQVFRSMADPAIVFDADGRVVDLNQQAVQVVGAPASDAIGRRLSDLLPELAPTPAALADAEETRSELTIETPDGQRVFDLQFSSVPDTIGDRTGYALLLRDVTARKVAEERADRRSRTVEGLLRVVNGITAANTPEEVFQRAADGGHEAFGADACRIAAVDGDRLVPVASAGDDPVRDPSPQPIDAGFAGETHRSGDPVMIDDLTDVRSGSPPDTGSTSAPTYRSLLSVPIGGHGVVQLLSTDAGAFDEDDRETVALFASHVETAVDRAEAEAELRNERDRLEEFASVVAHDLRNPLTIAAGRLELLADAEGAPDEHVAPLGSALDRMEAIITDILQLARRGDAIGEVSPVDVAACADDAWRSVDTDAARLCRSDALGTVRADRGRLQELFENLFRNSVEHGSTCSRPDADDSVEHGSTCSRPDADDSVEHGSTCSRPDADDSVEHGSTDERRERTDAESDPVVTIRVGPLDAAAGFYVADDGPGIPPDRRDRIFEYGHSSTADGTGIGLAVVERIVRAHGWEITVEESATGGARFDVTVERSDPQ